MSSTKGNIDAVVALYADGEAVYPQPKATRDPSYYNEDAENKQHDYYNDPEGERPDSYLTPVTASHSLKPKLPDPGGEVQIDISEAEDAEPIGNGRSDSEMRRPLNGGRPDDQVKLPLPSSTVKNRSGNNSNRSGRDRQMHGQEVGGTTAHSQPDTAGLNQLQYSVVDIPPWYLCMALAFQHYLIMFGATVANPMIMADKMCVPHDDYKTRSELIGTIFVVSGLATLLQTFLGVRLPIVQGGTFTFVTPSIAILSLPKWACPKTTETATADPLNSFPMNTTAAYLYNTVTESVNHSIHTNTTGMEGLGEPIWLSRIREIQGAIMVASVFQLVIGFSGVMGFLLRWIGPLAIAPTIALAGLALFDTASRYASVQWWIALVTVILIAMFSQYTKNIGIPCCRYERGRGFVKISFPLFRLFPVILAVVITWIIVWVLTVAKVFDPDKWGFGEEQSDNRDILKEAEWFRLPYPGQWGCPTVSTAAVFGMLAGVLASMLESVGDYYACARIAKVPPPPMHAINRGIGIEGLGCILAGAFGTGSGTTSYSENIGAIGITKVASRVVIQVGAAMMIFFGVFSKFGAIFLTIPHPIIGGVFIVMFGMITAVGISNLQFVDLNSSRNLFIIGFSFFFGLSLPRYIQDHREVIDTGSTAVDEIFSVLLTTSMFVGGLSGFVLDNTIPGTDEERGLTRWRQTLIKRKKSRRGPDDPYWAQTTVYQIEALSKYLKKYTWTKYIPFLPTFDEDLLKVKNRLRPKKKRKNNNSRENYTNTARDGENARDADTGL